MSSTEPIPDELGVAALPADASTAQRARAEALFRPTPPDQRCRCTGTGCEHGDTCPDCGTGHLIHADRYPGSLWVLTQWADDYVCDTCGYAVAEQGVELPELPWGYRVPGSDATTCYPDVRHPNFG